MIYAINKIVLLWPTRLCTIYYKNQLRQQRDWSYRFGLHKNQNWNVGTYLIGYSLWWKIDITDHIGVFYAKSETELLWLIRQGAIKDENKIGQWRYQLYRSGLSQKRYLTFINDRIMYQLWRKPDKITMWLIVQIGFMPKMKMSYCDWSNRVQSMMKTKQSNDCIDSIV